MDQVQLDLFIVITRSSVFPIQDIDFQTKVSLGRPDNDASSAFKKLSSEPVRTGAGPPIKPFEEGMAEVFRQFMHVQEQQEQCYLQALQTLQETMQQAIQPASLSLGLESP
ncbi:hypothetical protein HF521_007894 [Silurus meridionalis]|uniref:Uncharacterized protein n=1 Tax=Silurus meridionalis TaxID=175797 RepID=A0A8T0AQ86_SILME|nr:hypothetical protein HF521_007894 [Silurus meridionalis]